MRPQKLRLIYQIAPQICERIGLKNEIQFAPVSSLINPIPRITSLVIESMNRNYDGSDDGLDLFTKPIVPNTAFSPIAPTLTQQLFDSPANGPQHEWTDRISGMNFYRVHYSRDRQQETVGRSIFFDGYIKLIKTYPRTIRFKGTFSGQIGTNEIFENGKRMIQHGIYPTGCEVRGEFDFVELAEEPGFFQLWEGYPKCIVDPKAPFVSMTRTIYKKGEKVIDPSLGNKIGFWTKQ